MMNTLATRVLIALLLWSACAGASSCRRGDPDAPTVVLYYTVDDVYARPVIEKFERETGVRVETRTDTEATKTTGLVQRLRLERDNPVADVYWSGEPFMTELLAQEGVLDDASIDSLRDWPRPADSVWYPMAVRARVLVYNSSRVEPAGAPTTMHDLLDPRWRGRVVMARPSFGTTRGHMAALVALWGAEEAKRWFAGIEANGVRLLDGNSAVVRAVATGEADIGLTDTDDVWAGQRHDWPIDLVYIRHDAPGGASLGVLTIPTTVARVHAGPNPGAAATLIEYLLSERVERALAESDSHNFPLRPALREPFAAYEPPDPIDIDFAEVVASMDEAMKLCRESIGE